MISLFGLSFVLYYLNVEAILLFGALVVIVAAGALVDVFIVTGAPVVIVTGALVVIVAGALLVVVMLFLTFSMFWTTSPRS